MRTIMHYHPDYGASPERVPEYNLDPFIAARMLEIEQRSRAAFRAAAEAHFDACAGYEMLPEQIGDLAKARARFLACVDELVDDWIDQRKLTEAAETA